MPEEKVSLVKCDDYGTDTVSAGVRRAFALLGGVESIVRPGESVFVKVNAVMGVGWETAIVTNPEVTAAVIQELQKVTDRLVVGDSPGGPFTRSRLARVYENTGLTAVARRTGAELAMDTDTIEVPVPEGRKVKRVTLCRSMLEADHLFSISKFKTHRYMNVTGPIKNLYGSVPGLTKFVYHSRFEKPEEFADLIVDVHMAARPAFHIVDAVDIIDGDGSRHGRIRRMKVIAAGTNAFALESLMIELAGLRTGESKPLAAAIARGICPRSDGGRWYAVLGDRVEDLRIKDFQLPGENYFSERAPALVTGRLSRFLTVTPRPIPGRCTGCGRCVEICPRDAISLRDGLATVDRRKCIRCFCCDELCEQQAIGLREPVLLRIKSGRSRGAGSG